MTSIAIAYNKLWIAIAADSAATIRYWNWIKIFNANKIFKLSNDSNVWIGIYQSSGLGNTPREIIINEYKALNKSFDSMEDYVFDFIRYIETSDYISDENINEKIESFISILNNDFNQFIQNKINNEKWNISEEILDNYAEEFFNAPLFVVSEDRECPYILNEKWEKLINSCIKTDEWTIENLLKKNKAIWLLKFKDKIVNWFRNTINNLDILDMYTWLVFVWYWKKDYFPKVFHIQTKMKYQWKLYMRFAKNETRKQEPYGAAEWYADAEAIQNIVLWYSSRLKNKIQETLIKSTTEICKKINNTYNIDTSNELSKINEDIDKAINNYGSLEVNSFFRAISCLSREELWEVVETLVNLSSFRKKVSNKPETVWGKTDVAIISREDWFIWLKKKNKINKWLKFME